MPEKPEAEKMLYDILSRVSEQRRKYKQEPLCECQLGTYLNLPIMHCYQTECRYTPELSP